MTFAVPAARWGYTSCLGIEAGYLLLFFRQVPTVVALPRHSPPIQPIATSVPAPIQVRVHAGSDDESNGEDAAVGWGWMRGVLACIGDLGVSRTRVCAV
jgi:hypothetical protein